eukprot:scaffold18135_cov116-Isochrysis_galbana.AAC.2
MHFVGDVYPPIHSVWREKCSDEAMTQMAFYGLGAHRLQVVVEDGPLDASTKQPIKTKLFVVATNQLSQLPVREGLEHYGGDAFFCFDTWRVQKIVIRNQAEPWQKSHTVVRPGDAGWEYAKFRWRSSLFTLVTLVDHLFGIHFQISNSVREAHAEGQTTSPARLVCPHVLAKRDSHALLHAPPAWLHLVLAVPPLR